MGLCAGVGIGVAATEHYGSEGRAEEKATVCVDHITQADLDSGLAALQAQIMTCLQAKPEQK